MGAMLTTPPATAAPNPPAPSPLPGGNHRLTMPRFTLDGPMTAEQRDFLDTYGFIRFHGFADPETVRALREEVEDIDRRIIAEGRAQIFGVPLIISKGPRRYVQRMVFSSLFGPRLHRFLQDPRFRSILDVAGPDYRIAERERDGLVINHFRREEGSSYANLGWHTDSLRDVFYFERPRRYLNVGFYLDDSPIQKGGVRLLPGSHDQGLFHLLTRKAYFVDHRPDPDEFAIEALAGDLTIHDGRVWHRVATATVTGDASQRRVMYLPLMNGPVKEKHEGSPTPFYFRLKRLAGY